MNEDGQLDESSELFGIIDSAMKRLFRECPTIATRLAGLNVAAEDIQVEDPNLNLPELRADHVFILPEGVEGGPCALYLEYQLQPKAALLPSWAVKWAGLWRQLEMPVVLLALYLQKGDYATFPSQMEAQAGALRTTLNFTAIRLWEQTERIRSGELTELAPLLLLTEKTPTEATVREEVTLIRGAGFAPKIKAELLGIALLVAMRQFARSLLEEIFAEDLQTMEDLGIVGDWMKKWEQKGLTEGRAQGVAQGVAEGMAQGMAQGEAIGARRTALFVMKKRFGSLPPALVERVEQADAEWCNTLLERALQSAAVAEFADLYTDSPE